jgi:tRNA-specific 2-thiouridylase
MKKNSTTIAVGMSGGVDSSLAASLLKNEGYSVVGITMSIYSGNDTADKNNGHACYGPGEVDDIRLAKEVCTFLDIPHYVVDLKEEYKKTVLDYFTAEYMEGRTPNPCIRCNPMLKFGFMLEKARESGISFDSFATGHYVRTSYDNDKKRYVLKKAIDQNKDQSYFLYGLKTGQLKNLNFPLGGFTKEEVRSCAVEQNLPAKDEPESQDFIEGGDYSGLFSGNQIKSGSIVDTEGNKIGTHRGIIYYTIGQRKGIGISAPDPLYVLKIDAKNNTIVVGPKNDLFSDTLIAGSLNYLSIDPVREELRVKAKIRHNHMADDACIVPMNDGTLKVVFDVPQLSITPGQAIVFYDDDIVLGGGIIQDHT